MAEAKRTVTTEARRLARQHNSDDIMPGYIYAVNIRTGKIGSLISHYAAVQRSVEQVDSNGIAYMRISYGRMTQAEAQRFIDEKGQGW